MKFLTLLFLILFLTLLPRNSISNKCLTGEKCSSNIECGHLSTEPDSCKCCSWYKPGGMFSCFSGGSTNPFPSGGGAGCKEDTGDPCTPNPCKNSGSCSVVNESFKCECVGDWTGDTCEEKLCGGEICGDNMWCEEEQCVCNPCFMREGEECVRKTQCEVEGGCEHNERCVCESEGTQEMWRCVSQREIPEKIFAVYAVLEDDLNGKTAWNMKRPYIPDYLTKFNVNLYFLGMLSPSTCYENCADFLQCCGDSSDYENRLANPPESLIQLSQNRGNEPGKISDDALVLWVLGGQSISDKLSYWDWLKKDDATLDRYAQYVANWKQYGCDGIDLDVEEAAGSNLILSEQVVKFIKKLKHYWPEAYISCPAYSGGENGRYSQNLLSESGLLDLVGAMTYGNSGEQAYKNVVKLICGSRNEPGCSLSPESEENYNTCVKYNGVQNCFKGLGSKKVLLGVAAGTSMSEQALSVAEAVNQHDLKGLMIWCSLTCAYYEETYTNYKLSTCEANQSPSCPSPEVCQACTTENGEELCFGPYYHGQNMAQYKNIFLDDPNQNIFLAASKELFKD
jgi:hypothetical protein